MFGGFHTWANLPSFRKIFTSNEEIYDRTIKFYEKMSKLGFGPEVHSIICDNKLEIYMEYLPIKYNKNDIRKDEKEIKSLIKRLHKAGYVHGDLHGNNLAKDKYGKLKIIDFDTMFTKEEWETNPVVKEWIIGRWGDYWVKTLNRFLKYEEEIFYIFD